MGGLRVKEYKVAFDVGTLVVIRALGQPGLCQTIRIDIRGISYLISYWFDGKRYEEWLQEIELGPAT
jgi:hypothetical protein